ncbi:hypothetical protein IscW_ISCW005481 [Ixodes scapularis]|uniref:Uncharacterized protein n=1 Tax=Ixodes scapularis TaxID=6945 RepID=B7PM65_IXOSC|nr:hypothetical protein IscW_ISCW005481 [Ixodes scapularis]|eukprot:XP_002434863.1 hypothetical protein IscW_ISCW005481 [Ixodes scapularis]
MLNETYIKLSKVRSRSSLRSRRVEDRAEHPADPPWWLGHWSKPRAPRGALLPRRGEKNKCRSPPSAIWRANPAGSQTDPEECFFWKGSQWSSLAAGPIWAQGSCSASLPGPRLGLLVQRIRLRVRAAKLGSGSHAGRAMAIRRKKPGVPPRLPDAKSHRAGSRARSSNRVLFEALSCGPQPQEQARTEPPGAPAGHPEAEEAPPADSGSSESPQETRLQNRLRNNWSKLVTDKMTVMAFARSLKGHRCPAVFYYRS